MDHDCSKRFTRATAAKMMHHAYVGGLLEHTLGCVRLAERIALEIRARAEAWAAFFSNLIFLVF